MANAQGVGKNVQDYIRELWGSDRAHSPICYIFRLNSATRTHMLSKELKRQVFTYGQHPFDVLYRIDE